MDNNSLDKFNNLWREFLESEEELETTSKFSDIDKVKIGGYDYVKHQLLKTSFNRLNYNESKDFFTPQFKKELKNLLRNFTKNTQYQQVKIQKQINDLNSDEYEWKRRVKGHNSEQKIIIELFDRNYEKFKDSMVLYINPGNDLLKVTQRAYQNYFLYKLQRFMVGFMEALVYENSKVYKIQSTKLSEEVQKLTPNDYSVILHKYFSIKGVFVDLVKIIMKKANNNLFNRKNIKAADLSLMHSGRNFVVKRNSIYYEFRRVLALTLALDVINYLSEKTGDSTFHVFSDSIRHFLWRKQYKYDSEKNLWWSLHLSNLAMTILSFLEKSDIFEEKVNELSVYSTRKIKETTKYVLPSKLEDLSIQFTELPRVVVPDSVTDNYIDLNLKQSVFGENRVSKSDSFKKVLNTTQKRRFGINGTYLKILDFCLSYKPITNNLELSVLYLKHCEKLDLPFKLPHELYELESELDKYKQIGSISSLNQCIVDELKNTFVNNDVSNTYTPQLLEIGCISELEHKVQNNVEDLAKVLRSQVLKRKLAMTCLSIGDLYKKCPVYITETFCVRLRMYPKQPLVSRTSGLFKHILGDYTPLKITLNGLKNLLKCYYVFDKSLDDKYSRFIKNTTFSKKTGSKKLYTFFRENPLILSNLGDNFLYGSLLHAEIQKCIVTGKTAVNVEIDQTASACVFLALGLRNQPLAKQVNIISQEASCPYTYCMNNLKEFYDSHIIQKDEKAFNFLSKSRKLHKYAIMCFCYSQTPVGREEDFIERWYLETQELLPPSTEACLKEFAIKYDKFIDTLFPKITKQIRILLEVVDIVVRENGEMSISNMNGERLRWKRFKYKSITRKGYNPLTRQEMPYRIDTTELVDNNTVDDLRDHKAKFLSYLIHSIDAAVIHHFIVEMNSKHNYRINHLHDCVLLHPNYVDDFYNLVKELYSSDKLYNVVFDCVFEPAKNEVSTSAKNKIEVLEREFLENCDDFRDSLVNSDPRNVYRPES